MLYLAELSQNDHAVPRLSVNWLKLSFHRHSLF